jgi:hypothetical protein
MPEKFACLKSHNENSPFLTVSVRRVPECSLLNSITVAGHDILSSMKIIRNVIVVLALSAIALATSACPDKGPVEKAGQKIDKAIDKTKDAAKDATK